MIEIYLTENRGRSGFSSIFSSIYVPTSAQPPPKEPDVDNEDLFEGLTLPRVRKKQASERNRSVNQFDGIIKEMVEEAIDA